MTLYLQSFSAWVNQQVAQVQSSATALLNMTVGSVTRAILEANASIALWVQPILCAAWQGFAGGCGVKR